jgi:hypothetical protein
MGLVLYLMRIANADPDVWIAICGVTGALLALAMLVTGPKSPALPQVDRARVNYAPVFFKSSRDRYCGGRARPARQTI